MTMVKLRVSFFKHMDHALTDNRLMRLIQLMKERPLHKRLLEGHWEMRARVLVKCILHGLVLPWKAQTLHIHQEEVHRKVTTIQLHMRGGK